MENKSLAFDYMQKALFENMNIGDTLDNETKLNPDDKNELQTILDSIKGLGTQAMQNNAPQENYLKVQLDAMNRSMLNTYDTMDSLKESLQDVIKDAKSAYQYVLLMYLFAFYLGVALIVTSIIFAAQDKVFFSMAFGAIGLIDIVTHFIYKPPLDLQSSRANLAQLMVILTNWFSDVMNLNTFMGEQGKKLTLDQLKELSDKQNANTEKMLGLIERYCEPTVSGDKK
ncbi:MAG: hypothetical protein IPJ80_06375 [Saprospiraceae bacterium]|nr:hypothetical protein [Saprospiraceae bacterium]MBK7913108.1 hypothetical protein [Saprospiraceae bacterium]